VSPQAYLDLVQDFTDRRIPASEFERLYLQWFKAEEGGMDRDLFNMLDRLFISVDAYVSDELQRCGVIGAISENELRIVASDTAEKLRIYLGSA
jgi:hypothetical protein